MTAAVASNHVPFAPRLRAGRILWRVLPWLGAAVILVVAALALEAPDSLRRQAFVVAASLAAYALLLAVVVEALSPTRASLRLLPLSDQRAERLAFGFRVLLFFLLITELGAWLVRENEWRGSVAALLVVLRNVILVLVGAGTLSWSGALRALRSGEPDSFLGTLGRVLARWIVPLAVLTALFLVIARGLGYQPLARFVLWAAVGTALELVLAVLLFRYARRSIQRALRFMRPDGDSANGDNAAPPAEANPAALGIEIIATGLLKWAIGIATLLWILSGWGLSPVDLYAGFSEPVFGSGGVTWGHLIGGFADVAIVLVLGWLLKNVLVFFVFPRARVDVGARYAILAVMRYFVAALVLIFALSALGVETGSLGWFFGAAGIGLGLGLQDIIGNFFGGIIMLLQRPIRVGDIVTVGDASGTVEDIKMKGTTLRTFDNMTILIPNREMLASRILNMTHSMGHTRVRVDIGVSYDAAPEVVEQILLETALAHEQVVSDPEPAVIFQGYGASSLDFSLFCYTHELRRRVVIASEIRYALFERLQREGIEIPFPQQVIHFKDGRPPEAG